MSMKLEHSLAEGAHHRLNRMAGEWEGMARTWFEAGDPVEESPVKGSIRPVLGGRFLLHEYEGSFGGNTLNGIVLYGYDLSSGRFQSAWIDSFHMGTGIMFSRQAAEGNEFNVTGSYMAYGAQPQEWGWRTTIEQPDEDSLVITAYNITPEGEETKATEIVYKRK